MSTTDTTEEAGVHEQRARTSRRAALALTLALVLLAARPSPVASGPRPALPLAGGLADPWQAATPHVDSRFVTLPYEAADGRRGTWIISDQRLPLRVVIEQEIVARFGFEPVRDALTVWNGIPGSRFALEVAGVDDSGADRKRRDGVSRVFLDRIDCEGDFLARAHLQPGQVVERFGVLTNYLWEVDIGICDRMQPDRLASVLRHEVGHVAGLGHICDPGDGCWHPEMGQDNRCRVMYPSAYSCQEPNVADQLAFIDLYPRLPRIPAGAPENGPAAASGLAHRRARSVGTAVVVGRDVEPRLKVEAAHLAALRGGPLLVVGDDCTSGVGAEELNRVLTVQADVTVVGPDTDACASALAYSWELEVDRLEGSAEVLDAIVGLLEDRGGPRAAVIVDERDAALADAVMAVPAAVRLDAVVLRADASGLTEAAQRRLGRLPDVTHAVIIGGAFQTNRQVETDLIDLGLPYRRIEGSDRAATALALWADDGVYPGPADQVVLTSNHEDALIAAACVAASHGWPVLLTPPDGLDGRVAVALRRAVGGVVVGANDDISDEVQIRASRAVDS